MSESAPLRIRIVGGWPLGLVGSTVYAEDASDPHAHEGDEYVRADVAEAQLDAQRQRADAAEAERDALRADYHEALGELLGDVPREGDEMVSAGHSGWAARIRDAAEAGIVEITQDDGPRRVRAKWAEQALREAKEDNADAE